MLSRVPSGPLVDSVFVVNARYSPSWLQRRLSARLSRSLTRLLVSVCALHADLSRDAVFRASTRHRGTDGVCSANRDTAPSARLGVAMQRAPQRPDADQAAALPQPPSPPEFGGSCDSISEASGLAGCGRSYSTSSRTRWHSRRLGMPGCRCGGKPGSCPSAR